MIARELGAFLQKKRCTLLGVGPMSVNCVEATIELANEHDIPMFLIASRRQIDSGEFGGGYVNNWTTEQFAHYVTGRDKKGNILLARDHGGPWQNNKEKDEKMSHAQAMAWAKSSYRADLEAGFHVLHIDPSVDISGQSSIDQVLERVFELYEYCWSEAQKRKQNVIFEIGTEEQSGNINSQEELYYTLNAVQAFCSANRLPQPTFVVIQCGTRVMETRNVGMFDASRAATQLPQMIDICNRNGIFVKEHNTDYLPDDALRLHPQIGIHAANVAPEFGVTETRALLALLESHQLAPLAERFLGLAYESKKWDKWMLEDTRATDRDRAIIAGHYVFSHPECVALKAEAARALQAKGIVLEDHLKQQVKNNILRYLRNFRMVETA